MKRSKQIIIAAGLLFFVFAPAGLDANMLRSALPQTTHSTTPENSSASMAASGKSVKSNLRYRPKRLKGFKLWKKMRKELRQHGFEFKWGWFFLGVFLGPVGFLISLFNGTNATLSALIGFALWVTIALVILLTVPVFSTF